MKNKIEYWQTKVSLWTSRVQKYRSFFYSARMEILKYEVLPFWRKLFNKKPSVQSHIRRLEKAEKELIHAQQQLEKYQNKL